MADNTEAILAAISALDGKVDGLKGDVAEVKADVAGLKKTDETLATEVARIGSELKSQGREIQDLRAETLRTFESERHAQHQTTQAITKHVDEAAKAFHEKAADIDVVKAETLKQSSKLGIDAQGFWKFVHDTKVQDVVKIATLAAAAYAAWKGLK